MREDDEQRPPPPPPPSTSSRGDDGRPSQRRERRPRAPGPPSSPRSSHRHPSSGHPSSSNGTTTAATLATPSRLQGHATHPPYPRAPASRTSASSSYGAGGPGPSSSSGTRRYPRGAPPIAGSDFDRSLPLKSTSMMSIHDDAPHMMPGSTLPPKNRTLFNPGGPSDKPSGGGTGRAPSAASSARDMTTMPPPPLPGSSSPSRRHHHHHHHHHEPPHRSSGRGCGGGGGGGGGGGEPPRTIAINPIGGPPRELFDPRLHDPVRFARGSSGTSGSVASGSTGTTGVHSHSSASYSTGLSSIHEPPGGETGGDRDRERRKRREGSERKGGSRHGERDETKSRSSDGSESLKDRQRGKGGDTGVLGALRERYRAIQQLEASLLDVHKRLDREEVVVLGGSSPVTLSPQMGDDGWVELINRHMKLAHAHHDFLTESLDPRIPASHHNLPVRYNIPVRLWQEGFHRLVERMRAVWLGAAASSLTSRDLASDSANAARIGAISSRALDHMGDYILDAYSFYTALLDEQVLSPFRSAWIEALGDLARYRMAIAGSIADSLPSSQEAASFRSTPNHMARIDDDDAEMPIPSGNSIGKEVADAWDVEDRETWRTTARDWYATGVGEKPGEGRLHHRLALLSRDVKGEEERALYHFSKSLITNSPFSMTRESLLPLFDTALQSRRFHPDAMASELFVLLHGMIFTKIQLDDFDDVFARFLERLEEDRLGTRPLPQTEWIMMAVINLAACLQYGAPDGLLKQASAEDSTRKAGRPTTVLEQTGPQAIMVHATTSPSDGLLSGTSGVSDGGGAGTGGGGGGSGSDGQAPEVRSLGRAAFSSSDEESLPLPFRHALRLAFSVFAYCLAHPVRRDPSAALLQSNGSSSTSGILNPYIPIFLTFLSTVLKQPPALALLERSIPWTQLVSFFNALPRKIEVRLDIPPKITGGGPLPEDWCLRGMEWVGRRVYERGFWKQKITSSSSLSNNLNGNILGSVGATSSSTSLAIRDGPRTTQLITSEMDVLAAEPEREPVDVEQQLREGIVEGERGAGGGSEAQELTVRRWRRAAWALAALVKAVPGLEVDEGAGGGRKVRIEQGGVLARKMEAWEADRRKKVEALEARIAKEEMIRTERAAAEQLETGEEEDEELSEGDEDDEEDEELRALKAQRRHLRAALSATRSNARANRAGVNAATTRSSNKPSMASSRNLPSVLAGYTVLVFDTNFLLSSFALFISIVESGKWTAMVPLPVITELDGLAHQPAPLGDEASRALAYLTENIRTRARTLKVQTSRGNYLSDLTLRAEDISFSLSSTYNPERVRNMDDLILRACGFQEEHFVDRRAILGAGGVGLSDEGTKAQASKVVLLTFDRNLRLRARARGIDSTDERGIKKLLVAG